jgi:hypothetical protein
VRVALTTAPKPVFTDLCANWWIERLARPRATSRVAG